MSKIESNVMAAVRVIHTGRVLSSKTALELYALIASFAGIATMVSVSHVMQNLALVAGHGVLNVLPYLTFAVLKTNALVQVALALALCSLALLVRDMSRSWSRQSAFAV